MHDDVGVCLTLLLETRFEKVFMFFYVWLLQFFDQTLSWGLPACVMLKLSFLRRNWFGLITHPTTATLFDQIDTVDASYRTLPQSKLRNDCIEFQSTINWLNQCYRTWLESAHSKLITFVQWFNLLTYLHFVTVTLYCCFQHHCFVELSHPDFLCLSFV